MLLLITLINNYLYGDCYNLDINFHTQNHINSEGLGLEILTTVIKIGKTYYETCIFTHLVLPYLAVVHIDKTNLFLVTLFSLNSTVLLNL